MAQHSRQMTQKSARVGAMLGQCWLLGAHVGAILSLCWAKNGVFIWALALGLRWTRHFSVMWGPENSGAATWWRFGRARWRYVMRFRRVPGQIPYEICKVPEGSGAETLWGSGWFRRRRCLVRFRRVPVHIPCEVPEGSGTDASWKSKGFWWFFGMSIISPCFLFLHFYHWVSTGISSWAFWSQTSWILSQTPC